MTTCFSAHRRRLIGAAAMLGPLTLLAVALGAAAPRRSDAAVPPTVRLDPQHIYREGHMLLARGVAEVNPNYFVFHPSAAGQTADPQLIPYVRDLDAGSHIYEFDCVVDSRVWTGQAAPRLVEYEVIEPNPGAPKQLIQAPMGIQHLRFKSTISGGGGWYAWVLRNTSNTLWVFSHCDVTRLN